MKILAGLLNARFSEISTTKTTYYYTEFHHYKLKPALAFAYDIGINLKLNITRVLTFTLSADYLGGKPIFKEYTNTTTIKSTFYNETGNEISKGHKFEMPTGIVNLAAGLALSF